MTLFAADGEVTVPGDRIAGLERSLGRHRRFGRNFAIAVGVGALVGGTISAVTWTPCRDTGLFACFFYPESRTEAFSWGLAGGGLLGIPIGVIVGLAARSEAWETVSLPAPGGTEVSLRPVVETGVGLVASMPLGGRGR